MLVEVKEIPLEQDEHRGTTKEHPASDNAIFIFIVLLLYVSG